MQSVRGAVGDKREVKELEIRRGDDIPRARVDVALADDLDRIVESLRDAYLTAVEVDDVAEPIAPVAVYRPVRSADRPQERAGVPCEQERYLGRGDALLISRSYAGALTEAYRRIDAVDRRAQR